MGADAFYDSIKINDLTMNEAFNELREQALYDYGHRGYTGTLAEKDDYEVVKVPEGTPKELFNSWLEKKQSENSKWKPAFACEYNGYYHFFGWASS